MSGVAGIVYLDGTPVGRQSIDRMGRAIAQRGPDGVGTWTSGSVAFAHAMLHTTAESRIEIQPFFDAPCAIVADARIDNREDLLRLLEFASPQMGDAALILAAYRRWGKECPSHLEGDFAFVIWNERDQTLFAARDPFGVKQLVYSHSPRKFFAFASAPRALLALDEISRDIDEKRVADFLALHFDDPARTFYRAVRRLPGGCSLTLQDGDAAIERYWSPENVPAFELRGRDRDAQYADGYREHFTRAVRVRMRSAHPSEIGAMLSGGLDSTSIACVARDQLRETGDGPLPVFSWIFSDSMEADERAYQEAVIAAGGVRRIALDSAQLDVSPWTDVEEFLPDGPPYAPNHYLNSVAARHARDAGVRIVLDGLGGDSTISRGQARFVELFLGLQHRTLARELRALALRRGTSESLPRLFFSNVAAPLMPPSILAFAQRTRGRTQSNVRDLSLLTPGMAALTGASGVPHRPNFSVRQEHVAELKSPMIAAGLELLDHSLAIHGVEGRYPFFDRRLAEYCVSLPADQKFGDGFSRIVARRAMENTVPDAVRWRAGKGRPGLHVVTALRRNRAILDDLFVTDPSVLDQYVNIDALRAAYSDLLSERPIAFRTVVGLWSAAVLARWLRLRLLHENVLSA